MGVKGRADDPNFRNVNGVSQNGGHVDVEDQFFESEEVGGVRVIGRIGDPHSPDPDVSGPEADFNCFNGGLGAEDFRQLAVGGPLGGWREEKGKKSEKADDEDGDQKKEKL